MRLIAPLNVMTVMTVLALTACSTPQNTARAVTPTRAILYTNSVNVIMSENSLCVGNRPDKATEWTGSLSGCPYQFTYHARQAATAPPRQPLQKSNAATPTGPQIIVTDATGKAHVFATP